jgi:predicted DNA-binding transcriptional regulator AlpA
MSGTPSKAMATDCLARTGLQPRGLNRTQSAAYIGVGPSRFDRMVADGRMPKPKRVGERGVVWDREQLDSAFAALPDIEGRQSTDRQSDIWSRAKV